MHIYLDEKNYFITCRTLNGVEYFKNDYEKQIILDNFLNAKKKYKLKEFIFTILNNHYHFLTHLKYGKDLGKIMQLINGNVSRELNLNLKNYGMAKDFFLNIKTRIESWPTLSSENQLIQFLDIIKHEFKKSKSVIENLKNCLESILLYKEDNNLPNDITVSFLYCNLPIFKAIVLNSCSRKAKTRI